MACVDVSINMDLGLPGNFEPTEVVGPSRSCQNVPQLSHVLAARVVCHWAAPVYAPLRHSLGRVSQLWLSRSWQMKFMTFGCRPIDPLAITVIYANSSKDLILSTRGNEKRSALDTNSLKLTTFVVALFVRKFNNLSKVHTCLCFWDKLKVMICFFLHLSFSFWVVCGNGASPIIHTLTHF